MEEKHWIDYVVAIGSIATPILVDSCHRRVGPG